MAELSFVTPGGVPVQLDPTNRDFTSTLTALVSLVKRVSTEWTDFYPGDPGVAILQAMAYVADLHSYLLDRVQNESYLRTAQRRSSVVDLLRPLGYELSPPVCASADVRVLLDYGADPVVPVALPAQWAVATSGAEFRFELLASETISGAGTHVLTMVEGYSWTEEFVNEQPLNTPHVEFTVSRARFALNPGGLTPLRVFVDAVEWALVQGGSFIGYDHESEVYAYEVSSDGYVTVRFGNGTNGKFLPASAVVEVRYRTGLGAAANSVGKNRLSSIVSPTTYVSAVTNPAQPSGGSDEESIEHAKLYAPAVILSNERGLTREDFAALAGAIPGVASAVVAPSVSPMVVQVFVSATGPNPVPSGRWYTDLQAGSGLLGVVGRDLTALKAPPTILKIDPVVVVEPYFKARVQVTANVLRSDVQFEADQALAQYFLDARRSFGRPVPLSDLIGILEGVAGVHYVNVAAFHRLPVAVRSRGGRLAFEDASVSISSIQPQVESDSIRIRWLSPIYYELVGQIHGRFTGLTGFPLRFLAGEDHAVVRIPPYASVTAPAQLPQFSIRIDLGSPLPTPGDEWLFGIDNYVGNLAVEPYEVVVANLQDNGLLDPARFAISYGGGLA